MKEEKYINVSVKLSMDEVETVKNKLVELIELEEKAKSLADDLAKTDLKAFQN